MNVTIFGGLINYIPSSMENYKYHLLNELREHGNDIIFDEYSIKAINSIFLKGIINRYILYTLTARKHCSELNHILDQSNACILNFFPEKTKNIVVCHDIIPVINLKPNLHNYPFELFSVKGMKKADKIIADSNSTKQDLIHYFNIPAEKIRVILLAADEKFKPLNHDDINEVKQNYNLNFPFILYVGTLEQRKNISSLIKAFYKLKKRELPHKLVIAGKRGWKYKEIFETIDKLNLQKDVIFTGYVLDEDLPALYNAADLFVYPSLYEGFGLPPLESMACGTPVITSNTSSLPEVVGDAGIMVDPYDVDGLADAMHEVLSNDGLREDMIKRGLERAKIFSWEKCARETLKVYEEVYDE